MGHNPARADTTAGRVVGERHGPLSVFRGVPYARPPWGELRFASPRPPVGWSGERDATRFAAASFQPIIPGSSEDSLYANVWTPDITGSHPVLVYIHGGGWMVGAGSLGAYDGAYPAARGDIVVVTFNYRLGVFGFGLHEDLEDPLTGSVANWGLQDQVALLHWVHDNAAAFGGDPNNITLAGTSAGGASAWQLALLPQLRGIISRIVPISACHVWDPATALRPQDSRTVYEALARDLGTTVCCLREVPATVLADCWDTLFLAPPSAREVRSGREYRGPVVDGRWMPGFDHDLPTPDVPMVVVHTRTEGSFYTGPYPPQPPATPQPTDERQLRAAVHEVLDKGRVDVPDALVAGCVDAYREAAALDGLPADPRSIWTEVWGDALFRHQIVRLSERHAREGRTPQYVMEFAHPVLAPYFGTPHEATSPFLFGTYGNPEHLFETWGFPTDIGLFADGTTAESVSATFIDLVASFARDGVPRSAAAPAWPVFAPDEPTTMVLGGTDVARIAPASKQRQLRFWDDSRWLART
jgi:para-nitrobenzyl esterase